MPKNTTGKATIKKIVYKKGGAVLVFSDKEKLTLSNNAFTDFHLYEGKEVTPLEKRKLEQAAESDEIYSYALRLLSHEVYSVHDLRAKLLLRFDDENAIRPIVFRLKKEGLLDDELYAKSYADELADLRLYGQNRVLFELRKHGIPEAYIRPLNFPHDKELDRAQRYLESADKRYRKIPSLAKKKKAIKALLDRGFSFEVAEEASANLPASDPEQEQDQLELAYNLTKAKYARKYEGYELKRRLVSYLLSKGYRYEDIIALSEKEG